MSGDALISLPLDVVASILSSWLRLSDVGNVDRAYCQKVKRAELLKIVSSKYCLFRNCSCKDEMKPSLVSWIAKRKAKLVELAVNCCTTESVSCVEQILPVTGEFLQRIRIRR